MTPSPFHPGLPRTHERGNMLFMILIAVVLIGLLTSVLMSSSNSENSDIDKETLVIRTSEVQRTASELERAVLFILSNKKSETDIRFAHPAADPDYGDLGADTPEEAQAEVFSPQGGAANYPKPPEGINDGSKWEFYGNTAVPGVGSDKADLVAVLPNVTGQFCEKINEVNGQPTNAPTDSSDCINAGTAGRVNDSHQFANTPNTMDEASFAQDPNSGAARTALQACVKCGADNHFYFVLLAR